MSRAISNSNIYTESFEILTLKVSEIAFAISSEVITANSSYANTGSVALPRTAQLYGQFGANTIIVTDTIRGGNVNGLSSDLVVSSNLSVTGSTLFQNNCIFDCTSNNNIGPSTGTPIKIYSFPKTGYSSGKFNIQVKSGLNTQISELVLAHDTTTSYLTVYGSVSSPPSGSPSVSLLGSLSSNVNGANVEILLTQINPTSSVKVVANLIK